MRFFVLRYLDSITRCPANLLTGKFFWKKFGYRKMEVYRKFLQAGRTFLPGSLYQREVFISCKYLSEVIVHHREIRKSLSKVIGKTSLAQNQGVLTIVGNLYRRKIFYQQKIGGLYQREGLTLSAKSLHQRCIAHLKI